MLPRHPGNDKARKNVKELLKVSQATNAERVSA
jgi:hypothetical protein